MKYFQWKIKLVIYNEICHSEKPNFCYFLTGIQNCFHKIKCFLYKLSMAYFNFCEDFFFNTLKLFIGILYAELYLKRILNEMHTLNQIPSVHNNLRKLDTLPPPTAGSCFQLPQGFLSYFQPADYEHL